MRTIKFRGKRIDNGEWVYGDLLKPHTGTRIVNYDESEPQTSVCRTDFHYHNVDPATVGQFTGVLDKNGMEIYEGDILSTDLAIPRSEVVFRNGCFALRLNDGDEDFYDIISPIDESVDKTKYHNIIGSIHDHPELLNEK